MTKKAIGEANQRIDVHGGPDQPGRETRETQKAEVGDSISAADDGEVPLIPIAEWGRRLLSGGAETNEPGHVPTLLNRWAGQRRAW